MSEEKDNSIKINYCCQLEGHEQKQQIAVCISANCSHGQKLICSKCLLDGIHKDHSNEVIYLKDFVEYSGEEIFDIPLWKKEGESVFNKVCDYVIELDSVEREERISELFDAFRKNINLLIDEAEQKYKEKLGRDSEILQELTEKFQEISPISTVSEKCKQLYENQINQKDFEQFLETNIIKSSERQTKISELEELFNEIQHIEESLNFQNLSKQLIKELPQLLKPNSIDIPSSPLFSPAKKKQLTFAPSPQKDEVVTDQQDHSKLPSLNKQQSSVSKRELKNVLLLGKSNIGKSTMINTLIHREYQSDMSSHVQRNMNCEYAFSSGIKKYLLTFQEISGDEQITSENKSLLKNINAVVLLYDSEESLDELDKWIYLFIEFGLQADQYKEYPFILTRIVRKDESAQEIAISNEKVQKFKSDHQIKQEQSVEVSSLNSINQFLDNITPLL